MPQLKVERIECRIHVGRGKRCGRRALSPHPRQTSDVVTAPAWHIGVRAVVLLKRRHPLAAVEHRVTISMSGGHHDDRRLLTDGRQRRQQSPMPLRLAHAKVLETPLKLMEF